MRKILIILLLLSVSNQIFSQNNAIISGKVIDKSNNEPLPFVNVLLFSVQNNENLSVTLSELNGSFVLKGIPAGEYKIILRFLGYEQKEIPMLVGKLNSNFDIGKIELVPISQNLDEVTIQAKKEIVSSNLDKKYFEIDNSVASSGSSVMDFMKNLPGITVSQEGKIILRGSDKVSVLIDGKQSGLTGYGNQKGLENIPISNIEKIEIINNPSAKYDAAGMAGIVNIIYKKENEKGLKGDVGMSYGIGALTKPIADLPTHLGSYSKNSKYIPSLNFNYRTAKLNYFIQSEMFHQNKLPNNEFTTRTYTDGRRYVSQVPENRTQNHYLVNSGVDWNVNERNVFSISAVYDWEKHIDTAQVPYINMTNGIRERYWGWREEEITGFMSFGLNYKHKFSEPGHELRINTQYTKGWENESYFLHDSSSFRQDVDATHILAIEHISNISADYIKPLRRGRLEGGIKLQHRILPVKYTTEKGNNSIIYPGLGDWSNWGENTVAGYINYIREAHYIDIEAGIRAEHTSFFYEIAKENIYYKHKDDYNYFELFPNIRLTYKLNANNNVSAFYNRRIDRPGEPELRVFPKYDDPELLKVGNPFLRPQLTQSFELAYKHDWKSGSFYISGYHRIIESPFIRVYSNDTSNMNYNIVNKIYHNVGTATNSGNEIIVSQQLIKSWKLSASFNYFINKISSYQGKLYFPYERPFTIKNSSDLSWDYKINNQFSLPWKIQLQVTGVYYSPKNLPQGKQWERSSIDASIKQLIFKGKAEIKFSASDIFNNFGIKQQYTDNGFDAIYENPYETQIFTIGMKYKF